VELPPESSRRSFFNAPIAAGVLFAIEVLLVDVLSR